MSGGRGFRGLEGTRVLSSESRGVSGLGTRHSLLRIAYGSTGMLGVFSACGTFKAAGHMS